MVSFSIRTLILDSEHEILSEDRQCPRHNYYKTLTALLKKRTNAFGRFRIGESLMCE